MSGPLQERGNVASTMQTQIREKAMSDAASDSDSIGSRTHRLEDSENNPSGAKRKRTSIKWTGAQRQRLLQLFNQTTHPTALQRKTLANEMGVEEIKVLYWFDSQRRKRSRLSQSVSNSTKPSMLPSASVLPQANSLPKPQGSSQPHRRAEDDCAKAFNFTDSRSPHESSQQTSSGGQGDAAMGNSTEVIDLDDDEDLAGLNSGRNYNGSIGVKSTGTDNLEDQTAAQPGPQEKPDTAALGTGKDDSQCCQVLNGSNQQRSFVETTKQRIDQSASPPQPATEAQNNQEAQGKKVGDESFPKAQFSADGTLEQPNLCTEEIAPSKASGDVNQRGGFMRRGSAATLTEDSQSVVSSGNTKAASDSRPQSRLAALPSALQNRSEEVATIELSDNDEDADAVQTTASKARSSEQINSANAFQTPGAGPNPQPHNSQCKLPTSPRAAIDCTPRPDSHVNEEGRSAEGGLPSTSQPNMAIPWSPDWLKYYEMAIAKLIHLSTRAIETAEPLHELPSEPMKTFSKAQVVVYLPGCKATLNALLAQLHSATGSSFTQDSLRLAILDMATRKSLQPLQGDGTDLDALNDEDSAKLWVWEVRSLQSLPRHLQPQAKALKTRLNQASSNLKVLHAAKAAIEGFTKHGKSKLKAEKAIAKIQPLIDNASMLLDRPGISQHSSQPTQSPAERGHSNNRTPPHEANELKPAAPSGSADIKAQEKEAIRRQKELDKENARQEKEQQRLEREREKEEQRQNKKLKTELAGFGSKKTIEKSRNAFTSFFKKAATPATQKKVVELPQASPLANSPVSVRTLSQAYSPAIQDPLRIKATEIDDQLRDAKSGNSGFNAQVLSSWKRRPRHKRQPGKPPSWARRQSSSLRANVDSEVEIVCENWRRKFLWFPADLGDDGVYYEQLHWPAYYGSWTKPSVFIKPRKPLAKDPGLDYEAMEDEEWEPEPEGDNLSQDDGEEMDVLMEDSAATDGFFVPDGQLSDDEGISSAQHEVDQLCADQLDSGSSALAIDLDNDTSNELRAWRQAQKLFEAAMRKAHPRPLIISRLSTAHDTSGYHGCLTGEASLLSAFTVQVVAKDIQVSVPAAPEDGEDAVEPPLISAPKATNTGASKVGRPSGPAGEKPEEMIPVLVAFLKSHPQIRAVPKVVQAFCDAHPERKMIKKWVADKIKELAERGIMGWTIKAEMPPPLPLSPEEGSGESPAKRPLNPSQAQLDGQAGFHADAKKLRGEQGNSIKNPEAREAHLQTNIGTVDDVKANDPLQKSLFSLLPKIDRPGPKLDAAIATQQSASQKIVSSLQKCQADSLSNPGWKMLADCLSQHRLTLDPEETKSLFRIVTSCQSARLIPAFIVKAMLKTLSSSAASQDIHEGCLTSLTHIVRLLRQPESSTVSPSNLVWADSRTSPKRVSLADITASTDLTKTMFDMCGSISPKTAVASLQLLDVLLSDNSTENGSAESGAIDRLGPTVAGNDDGQHEHTVNCSSIDPAIDALRVSIAGNSPFLETLVDTCMENKRLHRLKWRCLGHLLHSQAAAEKLMSHFPSLQQTNQQASQDAVNIRLQGLVVLLEKAGPARTGFQWLLETFDPQQLRQQIEVGTTSKQTTALAMPGFAALADIIKQNLDRPTKEDEGSK